MLARPHIKHLDVGHIILLRNSHTFFIARPDTILGPCPVPPTSTTLVAKGGTTIFHSFPQLRHGTTTIPFLCDARFLPINLGAILFTGKKSTCTQIPLSAQPDLASMQSSPLLERSGRRTSLFALQAKKSGGFLADSTH